MKEKLKECKKKKANTYFFIIIDVLFSMVSR